MTAKGLPLHLNETNCEARNTAIEKYHRVVARQPWIQQIGIYLHHAINQNA